MWRSITPLLLLFFYFHIVLYYFSSTAVGQNLMDHHEFNMIYELDPTKFMWRWQATYLHEKFDQLPENIKPIVKKYYAKKEVILCAGSIGTPQIMMLSGLGDRDHLENLGINVLKNIPEPLK